jgi:hypothetical protein
MKGYSKTSRYQPIEKGIERIVAELTLSEILTCVQNISINRYKLKINTTPGRHDSASELEPMNGCCGEPVELSEEESGEQAILELT